MSITDVAHEERVRAADALRARWTTFREQNPKVRIRDAATELGVSEAELVALDCGTTAVRLEPRWEELLRGIGTLGIVTAITRNESVVHEKHGRYETIEVDPMHMLVLGDDIDLRLFPRAWAKAFAVTSRTKDGERMSLQIFDAAGTAIHKVFATDGSDLAAFERLRAALASPDQAPGEPVSAKMPPTPDRPDAEIDAAGMREAWRGLQDTHDFFPMLRRFRVGRQQALRLAEREFAWEVDGGIVRRVLEQAAARAVPIMAFVGNPGAIQIHTGPVKRIQDVGTWLNVLDPEFNLHLREDHVATAWVVRKPSVDGIVTSIEVFDTAGELIVQFFGKRKPGIPERDDWRALVNDVQAAPAS